MSVSDEKLEQYKEQKWLQHPEEVDESYYFFFKYYLTMPRGGRSVLGAYKEFLVAEKGLSEEEASKKSISSYYHHWSNGRDKVGTDIPSLDTYEDRAKEYDTWIFADEMNELLNRRNRIINTEYEDAERMLYMWNLLMVDAKTQYDIARQKASLKEEGSVNISPPISSLKNLIRSRDEIAVFMRRAVGMMDKVTEDALLTGQEETMKIEWTEPKVKKHTHLSEEEQKLNDMGYEEFDAYIEKRLGVDDGGD